MADTINGASSATTSYGHDALNRVTTITQVGAGIADKRIHYGYNPLGQYAAIERYRDLAATELVVGTNYTYDDLNRLDEMRHNNANGATLNFHNLDYDIASRITRITDIDGTHDYAYDDRNQLIGASHETISIPDETYEFDANGNRLNSHLHGSGYVTGPGNRLLSDGIYNYEYDDEGNTVKRTRIAGTEPDGSTIRDFEWDHRNRLVSVTDKQPDGTATQVVRFTYDALDRRISKSVDNTPGNAVDAAILHFINDREDVLLDFLDGDGSGPEPPVLSQRYLHGPGIDQVLAQDDGAGTVHWHLADHLGTVKDLVDQTGAVANHINYDSFGSMVAETNAAVTSRYGFTGREWDEELSLQHNRARRYDATNGRFVGEDSLRFRWGLNLFMYALNSPVEVVDPSGRGPQATPTVPPVALPTPDYHLAPFYDPITPPIDPNVEYESCVDGCTNFMGGLTTACVILLPNIKLIHRFLIGVGMSMSTTASCESICWKYYLPTPASSNGSIP